MMKTLSKEFCLSSFDVFERKDEVEQTTLEARNREDKPIRVGRSDVAIR